MLAARYRTAQVFDGRIGEIEREAFAQRHQHDLWRDTESERHQAAAEAAGDHDVAIGADVAIDQPLARRRHRRPSEQPKLAAMGMPGKLQHHPRRYAQRHVGLVRQQNDRCIVGDFRKRRREIVDADALDRPEPTRRHIGQLIAETGEPERPAVLGQSRRIVVVNRDAGGLQRAPRDRRPLPVALHGLVFPPIVIAEDRVDAERSLQFRQYRRPFAGRNEARHMAMPGDIVAEQYDDVGAEAVGMRDDLFDPVQRHPGIAGVNICDGGDLELETGGPLRRLQIIARHAKPQQRLDAESVSGGRGAEGAETLRKRRK